MALLPIILEGDPRLRQKATRIKNVDAGLTKLAADMHETMDAAPGVGLAGPQVGVMRRIIVVHVDADEETGEPEVRLTMLNPEIVKAQGLQIATEGCLSIPGWIGDVPRADLITVKGVDLNGKHVRMKAEGYLARVFQHEIDHLEGILFIDRVEDRESLIEIHEEVELAERV